MANLNDLLFFSIRAAMKKIEKCLGNRLGKHGVSIPQSFILLCLQERDGITLKEIGNRTLIDSSSMTVLVDKLEKDKLVERRLDPNDRRAIRVFITVRGKNMADEIEQIEFDFNSRLYDLLGEGNQKEFVHGINNIVNQLK
jgi:DNA-binding MarR family transcriptional regulator